MRKFINALIAQLIVNTRENGEEYRYTATLPNDDVPDSAKELIYAVSRQFYGESFPPDSLWDEIYHILVNLEAQFDDDQWQTIGEEGLQDSADDFPDIPGDDSMRDLLEWLLESPAHIEHFNAMAVDYQHGAFTTLDVWVRWAQAGWRYDMQQAVAAWLDGHCPKVDNHDEDVAVAPFTALDWYRQQRPTVAVPV